MPTNPLSRHMETFETWIHVKEVTPLLTDNEVRYEQGKAEVLRVIQERSRNDRSAVLDSDFINALIDDFKLPETDWRTPVGTLMYLAGIKFTLATLIRYHDEELT